MPTFEKPTLPQKSGNVVRDLSGIYAYLSELDVQLSVLLSNLDEKNIPKLSQIRQEIEKIKEKIQ